MSSEAIEKSILHWQEEADRTKLPKRMPSALDCALCQKYENDCEPCPVSIVTGSEGCEETPYYSIRIEHDKGSLIGYKYYAEKMVECLQDIDGEWYEE